MEQRLDIAGAAHLQLADGVRHLRPEEAVFEAMLAGFTGQQSSRLLSVVTTAAREAIVRRFALFTGTWPWQWTASDVEDWTSALRSAPAPRAHSTVRSYQNAVALFMTYLTDRRYNWAGECETRFGTHPVQICHEWNTVTHTADHEGRPQVRPFTRVELQKFFDFADEQVTAARTQGVKGATAAFRDATLFKVIYAFGLRRNEAAMLDLGDFTRNTAAPEFGRFGACNVRYGKAMRGGPPRRRTVLTAMAWSAEVLEEYVEQLRPRYTPGSRPALWPTERGGRIRPVYIDTRFAQYRDQLGLPAELHPHCLRNSYVTYQFRGRVRPVLRPAAGRTPVGSHDRALHRGQRGLQEPDAAPRPGRGPRPAHQRPSTRVHPADEHPAAGHHDAGHHDAGPSDAKGSN